MKLARKKLKLKIVEKNLTNIEFYISEQPEVLRSSALEGAKLHYEDNNIRICSNVCPYAENTTFWIRGSRHTEDRKILSYNINTFKKVKKAIKKLNKRFKNKYLY